MSGATDAEVGAAAVEGIVIYMVNDYITSGDDTEDIMVKTELSTTA